MLFLRILLPGKTNGQTYSDSAQIFAKNTPILRTRYSQIHVAGVLQTRGKPSTWLPRGRLVELCTTESPELSENEMSLRRTIGEKQIIEGSNEDRAEFFDETCN